MRRWMKNNPASKLYRYLTKRDRIPPLPPGLSTFYDPTRLNHDHKILILASLAKDPGQAQTLMEKYQAETALDVLNAVHRRRRTWQDRLLSLMQRLTGVFPYNPLPGMMTAEQEKVMQVNYRLKSMEGEDE